MVLAQTDYEKMCELYHNETVGDHNKSYTLKDIRAYIASFSNFFRRHLKINLLKSQFKCKYTAHISV